jgi:hypothetical protein
MYYLREKEDPSEFAKYFVLYKIDNKSTKQPSYPGVELYDCIKYLGDEESAKKFAYNNLPARIGKRYDITSALGDADYLVVGKFDGKYKSYCGWDDTSEWLTTYDAVRCKRNEIEAVVNHFSREERFKKLEIGIETKLF